MELPSHLLTSKILDLKLEAEQLSPGRPLTFEVMTQATLLHDSAGAAVVSGPAGSETIYIDPARVDEYKLAHEMMHVILHRSGWPRMFYLLPSTIAAPIERDIADDIDNVCDHWVFFPRLKESGFDLAAHDRWYISVVETWPAQKTEWPETLCNAFNLLDGLIAGVECRQRIVDIVRSRQPQSLALAEQLEGKLLKARDRTRVSMRQSVVEMLDYLDRWVTRHSRHQAHLREQIGVTPGLFADNDLVQPASKLVNFLSHPLSIHGADVWLGAFELRMDGTRFHTICKQGFTEEPEDIAETREKWKSQDLRTFLESVGIMFQAANQACLK